MRFFMILTLLSGCGVFDGKGDAAASADADAADATAADVQATDASDAAAAPVTCALLGSDCGANHACYPFPFESQHPTGTLCGLQGTGTDQIPCASQLDCDAQSICSGPGLPESICLTRCDPNVPTFSFCAVGQGCSPLPLYRGVGVCLSL